VLRWYADHGRDLPWRRTRDPYAVLVSELMLQQTQVARVVGRWERWLERFPSPVALAAAPVGDALRAWSGLGYNRRAVALHGACGVVAVRGWPEDLTSLPGVGPYTAAAVGAFAFGRPVAAVDTNVRRVIERHDGTRRPPVALAARAAELLDRERPADWNHAMMDLGATVCTARAPRCGACPLRRGCRSRGRVGSAERIASAGGAASTDGAASPSAPARASRRGPRFEDTDRYVRGRILADLVAGRPPLDRWPPGRFARALAGLERDGLVVVRDGRPHLP
jgi:A/G-specific adenine glycosylase